MVTPAMRQSLEIGVEQAMSSQSPQPQQIRLLQTPERREIALALYQASDPVPFSKVEGAYESAFGETEHSRVKVASALSWYQRYDVAKQAERQPIEGRASTEPTFELTPEGRDLIKYLTE